MKFSILPTLDEYLQISFGLHLEKSQTHTNLYHFPSLSNIPRLLFFFSCYFGVCPLSGSQLYAFDSNCQTHCCFFLCVLEQLSLERKKTAADTTLAKTYNFGCTEHVHKKENLVVKVIRKKPLATRKQFLKSVKRCKNCANLNEHH
jgi:hypothetical protein